MRPAAATPPPSARRKCRPERRRLALRGALRRECTALHSRIEASPKEFAPTPCISDLFGSWASSNPLLMVQQETITLTGTYESRLAQLLRAARHQARLAQAGARPRMQDALTELEDALSDQLGALEGAAEADLADAETGEAERIRQSWRPLRAA